MDRPQIRKTQPAGSSDSSPDSDAPPALVTRLREELRERERSEVALRRVVEGTAAVVGEEFFRGFVRSYARAFGVKQVAAGRFLDEECTHIRTLAAWTGSDFREDLEYDLAGTPCQEVLQRGFACFERGLRESFPGMPLLDQLEAQSYVGALIRDGEGRALGLLVAIDDRPLQDGALALSVLQTFAGRAAVELGRMREDADSHAGERRLSRVIAEMPVMMAAYDEEGRLAVWNKECERVTGYSAEELVGDPRFLDRLCPDPRYLERMRAEPQPFGDYRDWVWRITARNGSVKTIAWSSVSANCPVRGWSTWEIGVDLTPTLLAEREQQDLIERVREAQKLESLGLLAGGIAHDFNNLLVGILGNTELLLENFGEETPEHDLLNEVNRAAQRAAGLTRQMLAYSGRFPLTFGTIDLADLVCETRAQLDAHVPDRVTIHYDVAEDVPGIKADAEQLRQVLANLVTNSVEALGETRGTIALTVGWRDCDQETLERASLDAGLPPGRYVQIEVADTGCGMDPELLGRIFDPFYSSKFTGRGLGLAAVQGIVRGHRGTITVESSPGVGTTFRILLPASETRPARRPAQTVMDQEKGLVLVVDDEDLILNLAKKSLEHAGFEVLTARDGYEAVEVFREHHARVVAILLDMTMPQMDGVETHRELTKIRADVPVILSSGFSIQEAGQRFAEHDLADFIQKPYRPRDLIEKVQSVATAP